MFTGRHHFSLFKLCCHLPAALNQASRVCEPSVPPLGLGGLTDTDKRHSTRPAVLGKVCATGLPLNIRGSTHWDFPGGTVDKNAPANAGDTGSIPDPGWSIPHAEEQLKPMSHNYRARRLQLLKPVCPDPVLTNKGSHRSEKPGHPNKELPPLTPTTESLEAANEDPVETSPAPHKKKQNTHTHTHTQLGQAGELATVIAGQLYFS